MGKQRRSQSSLHHRSCPCRDCRREEMMPMPIPSSNVQSSNPENAFELHNFCTKKAIVPVGGGGALSNVASAAAIGGVDAAGDFLVVMPVNKQSDNNNNRAFSTEYRPADRYADARSRQNYDDRYKSDDDYYYVDRRDDYYNSKSDGGGNYYGERRRRRSAGCANWRCCGNLVMLLLVVVASTIAIHGLIACSLMAARQMSPEFRNTTTSWCDDMPSIIRGACSPILNAMDAQSVNHYAMKSNVTALDIAEVGVDIASINSTGMPVPVSTLPDVPPDATTAIPSSSSGDIFTLSTPTSVGGVDESTPNVIAAPTVGDNSTSSNTTAIPSSSSDNISTLVGGVNASTPDVTAAPSISTTNTTASTPSTTEALPVPTIGDNSTGNETTPSSSTTEPSSDVNEVSVTPAPIILPVPASPLDELNAIDI